MARWRCRLRLNAPGQDDEIANRFQARAVPDDGLAHTEVTLSLDGELPTIAWRSAELPGDPSEFLSSPEGRRFRAVYTSDECIYSDSVLGEQPALKLCDQTLFVLQPQQWNLYLDLVMTWIMLRETSLACLHSAVCATKNTTILLIGLSGSGKSTLAYALSTQGADIYDDESAFFDLEDGRLYVRGRDLALRPGGVGLLKEPPNGFWYEAKSNDPKCAVVVPRPARPCPQDRVCLIFHDGFGSPELTTIPGGDATFRLARGMGFGNSSLQARLDAAASIVSKCPSRRLTLGPPDITAALLLSVVDTIS